MAPPEAIVRDFCRIWARRDIDEILSHFAPDAVYHNMPMAPAQGLAAIRGILEMFVPPAQHIEFELLNVAVNGSTVFTERVDHFVMGDRRIDLPVTGVFEIRDGKIAAWRDYFDLQTFMAAAS